MITIRIGKLYLKKQHKSCLIFFPALAVYTRSPAAYEALKKSGIIQLPSKSTLQRVWQEPKSEVVLIFDEVKVACQLMWNSRSHQLMGFAMTHKELPSLNDIYWLLKEPESIQQTSYILQFLWHDLTSEFDCFYHHGL